MTLARPAPDGAAMLPLAADQTPATAAELAQALERGLLAHGLTPRRVAVEGGAFPRIERFRLDLTDAHFARNLRPPPLTATSGDPVSIADFAVVGDPFFFEKTPATLRMEAREVQARLVGDADGRRLALESAESGTFSLQIARSELEALVHGLAAEAAAKQGLEVRQTSLAFTQEGPRGVSFVAEVTAKIFVMSAALALSGRLTIDDELNARVSGLSLGGDAMVTKLAGSFIRPHLDRLEGRAFPLLAYTAGRLKLREIELVAGPTLEIRARFGSGA